MATFEWRHQRYGVGSVERLPFGSSRAKLRVAGEVQVRTISAREAVENSLTNCLLDSVRGVLPRAKRLI